MKKNSRHITILFVADDDSRMHSLRVRRGIVQTFGVLLALFSVGVAALLLVSADIAAKLQLVNSLKSENGRLKAENGRLHAAIGSLEKLQEMGAYLRRLALASGDEVGPAGPSGPPIYKKDSIDNLVDRLRLPVAVPRGETPDDYFSAVPCIRPVEGWVTKKFSGDGAAPHDGVDYAATEGSPVRATAPGIVCQAVDDAVFGRLVVIEHEYGFTTRYGHCSQILVPQGVHVKRGQTIALVGSTGQSSAPHLHYEVHKDGRAVDPATYIFDYQR